jgi:hypothetical protein
MIKQHFGASLSMLMGFCLADAVTAPVWAQSPLAAKSFAGLHLAVSVQGRVTVQRPDWSGQVPVVFGTYLRIGDLLRVEESSQTKVVCSDLTLRDLPVGIVGVPCAGVQPLLRSANGSLINPTRRSGNDASFPVVLSPRKTKLLSLHPLLRWTPVDGASSYYITVRGPNLDWTAKVGSLTKLRYPDSAPELKAGLDYKLIVETGGHSSASEPGLGLGFSVLGNDERKAVAREQRKIEDLGLPSGPAQFLRAHVYVAHGLNSEAIQQLEDVSKSFQVAAIFRVLGDLYLVAGLTRQAEAAYTSFLNLSGNESDIEGEMLAHLSLGRIYAALGNRKLASQHLEASLVSAKRIGDRQTADRAEGLLGELKEQESSGVGSKP